MICYKNSGNLKPPIHYGKRSESSTLKQSETRKKRFLDGTYKRKPKENKFCIICSTSIKSGKTCGKKCRHELYVLNGTESLRKRRLNGEIFSFRKRSRLENTFQKFLESKGMKNGLSGFLTEVYAKNKTNKTGYFRLDFVIPRKKLIIEVDGKHHEKPNQLKHDIVRDFLLLERGWRTIRINYYCVNKTNILEQIYQQELI